jgi:hypothetical protein
MALWRLSSSNSDSPARTGRTSPLKTMAGLRMQQQLAL